MLSFLLLVFVALTKASQKEDHSDYHRYFRGAHEQETRLFDERGRYVMPNPSVTGASDDFLLQRFPYSAYLSEHLKDVGKKGFSLFCTHRDTDRNVNEFY